MRDAMPDITGVAMNDAITGVYRSVDIMRDARYDATTHAALRKTAQMLSCLLLNVR